MKLYDLRTEYRVNPIGIAEKNPRFSWKLESEVNDTVQQLYHIVVKDCQKVDWEIKVESEDSVLIAYAGDDLQDETLYNVTVEVTDNHENTASGEMSFETGILNPEVFKAKMITQIFPKKKRHVRFFLRHLQQKEKFKEPEFTPHPEVSMRHH